MTKSQTKKLDLELAAWTAILPVDAIVVRYKLINPLREGTVTKIRHAPYILGGHSIVVMVEGVSGCVLAESVVPNALLESLALVRDGADVTDLMLAQHLRKLEARWPRLITICGVMGHYTVTERLPYFGAIATEEGKKALEVYSPVSKS